MDEEGIFEPARGSLRGDLVFFVAFSVVWAVAARSKDTQTADRTADRLHSAAIPLQRP